MMSTLFVGGNYGDIPNPEPSAQEQELYDLIISQIEQYNDYNQMMMPFQLQQAGYEKYYTDPEQQNLNKLYQKYQSVQKYQNSENPEEYEQWRQAYLELEKAIQESPYEFAVDQFKNISKDWDSSYRKMSDEDYYNSLNAQEKLQYDLQKSQAERSLAAIEGTLEFSPALEEQRQKEWDQLKQVYGTIEGDSWDTASASDTVGQQNLDQFKRRWTMMEEAVRHGQAGSDVQSAALASGLTTGQTANKIGTTQAIGSTIGGSIPMYQSVLNPLQGYNMAGYQANIYNQANRSAQWGSILGTGAMLGGLALFSSKDYKTGLKKQSKEAEDRALKLIMKTRSYKYKYKPEMKMGNKVHLGTITEESPKEIVTPGGKAINLGDKLELQSMAIKALARKLEKRRSA